VEEVNELVEPKSGTVDLVGVSEREEGGRERLGPGLPICGALA
jgi:hypothetical protein